MTNNFLSELSGACAILILSSRLLYALRRFFASSPKLHSQLQIPTDDQRRLAEWYSSRTRTSDDGLRLCLDCPPEAMVASPSQLKLGLHYYDHHAPQNCRFCNISYHGNLEGGAHIQAHHPQQWESFSASKKMWWATECHKHHYRLKRARFARAYRMAVERRRWASESRAKSLSSLPDYDAVSGVRREVTRGGIWKMAKRTRYVLGGDCKQIKQAE
jgi:hypothetical protein